MAKLLGVECDDLYKNLLKPRIKVGNEFVTQGRNKDQVQYFLSSRFQVEANHALLKQRIATVLGHVLCRCYVQRYVRQIVQVPSEEV